jgi:hypothetical protein
MATFFGFTYSQHPVISIALIIGVLVDFQGLILVIRRMYYQRGPSSYNIGLALYSLCFVLSYVQPLHRPPLPGMTGYSWLTLMVLTIGIHGGLAVFWRFLLRYRHRNPHNDGCGLRSR